ncbi:MAG: glycosyltransferase [Nitrosopumilus sp.]|nr:glycosyltransferase [Nitrosopumilus sp.]
MSKEQISICTIISKNYLAHARVLTDSFLKNNSNGRVFVLLTDTLEERFDPKKEKFTLFNIEDIKIENLKSFCFKYTILERNTGIKASFLKFLLNRYNLKKIAYFDPDIFFTNSLENLWKVLDKKSILLTPHITEHIKDDKRPTESEITNSGIYNLGFIGISNSESAKKFLDWWESKLLEFGFNDVKKGMFTDQKWVDEVPSKFKDVFIINHPGYNVAYWNLMQRTVKVSGGKISVNGKPMYFFHFSGFVVEDIEKVSKHQNRFTLSNLKNLRPFFELYRDLLIEKEYFKTKKWKCKFDYFDNGIKIPEEARKIFVDTINNNQNFKNPFSTNELNSFLNYLNENIDDKQPYISRLWFKIYQEREDLKHHFPDPLDQNRNEFAEWIKNSLKNEYKLDKVFCYPENQKENYLVSIKPEIKNNFISQNGNKLHLDKRGINVAGYFKGEFGVAEAARNYVKSISKVNIPFVLNNINSPAHRNNDKTFNKFENENPFPVNLICVNADQSEFFYNTKGSEYFKNKYNIAVWFWEIADFPKKWMNSFNYFDEIWVASNFIANSLSKISPIPVVKIESPFEIDETKMISDKSKFGFEEDEFLFLFIFDYNSIFERKNPLAIIEAFKRSFKENEKVRLVIKCTNGDKFPEKNKKLVKDCGVKNITLLDKYLDRNELLVLIASCDCYISLHRGEGLGLTIAEAMYAKKPVIATHYGGNTDFMNLNNSYPVKYKLVKLEKDYEPYQKGSVWAEPNIIQASDLMKEVYENKDEAKKVGLQGYEDVKKQLNFNVVGEQILKRLDIILD